MLTLRRTFTILLFAWCQCAVAVGQTRPTARAIIETMIAQYKHASSYQDSGTVDVIEAEPKLARYVQSPPHTGTLVSFKTYFASPDLFRFDWRSAKSQRESSIWFDGKGVYRWMPSTASSDKRFTLFRSNYIEISVDEAAGQSAGAVFPIISMLVAKSSVVSFDDLLRMSQTMTLTGEAAVDGEMCHVIKLDLSGAPWTLWVGKQTHLLRKTRTVYVYGSFDERVETGVRHEFFAEETRHDIRINEPISKELFKYRPTLRPDDTDLTH